MSRRKRSAALFIKFPHSALVFKYCVDLLAVLHNRLAPLVVIVAIAIIPTVTQSVSGHGLGSDQAPPISFSGMNVTVRTDLTPPDLTIEDINDINMKVRFFDVDNDTTLEMVTYRIEVWHGGELLARSMFYDPDGSLDVEIRPNANCDNAELWRCSVYGGSEHPISPGALFVGGVSCNGDNYDICARPTITGPIFEKGGLYNMRVDIEGATSPKVLLAERLSYETFVSIAQEQNFAIQAAHAEEIPVVIKTYYDEVGNFVFDASDNSISFDMPFDWTPDYVDQVPVVHEEVRIPKDFVPYAEGAQFKGYVNGVEVGHRALLNDPYASNVTNTVHFLITNSELQKISESMEDDRFESKNMNLRLVPIEGADVSSVEFYLVDLENPQERAPTTVTIKWDGKYGADDEIPFEFTFLDQNNRLIKDIWYEYIVSDESGSQIAGLSGGDPLNPGIASPEGIDVQNIRVPSEGLIRVDVIVYGTGLGYDPTYSGIGSGLIEIGPGAPAGGTALSGGDRPAPDTEVAAEIPPWIKTNAGWWAEGAIDDATFVSGIQYLIQSGILAVPAAGSDSAGPDDGTTDGAAATAEIPPWIKTNAGWWAEGAIDDESFVAGLQYLIKEGIIRVVNPAA